jgi:hypothetical protein
MTIDFSENVKYLRYCEKRLELPLYYCYRLIAFPYTSMFDKGMYRCEVYDDEHMIVFNDFTGTIVHKSYFNIFFKKPSKLRLFLHKYFIWF